MNENDCKEFAKLGVKTWLIKQLFTLGEYCYVFVTLHCLLNHNM